MHAQTFSQHTRIFHSQAAAHADQAALEQTCRNVVDSWRAYSQTLQSLPAAGLQRQLYDSLERVRVPIDPAVAELAILMGL